MFHFGFALHWQKSPPSYHLLISDPSKLSYITLVFTQFEEHKRLLATGMKWFTFIVFVHPKKDQDDHYLQTETHAKWADV